MAKEFVAMSVDRGHASGVNLSADAKRKVPIGVHASTRSRWLTYLAEDRELRKGV